LSDVIIIFWSSIVGLTLNGRFLDYVAVEFGERYIMYLNETINKLLAQSLHPAAE
jgi:hypothetical protein